MALLAAEWLELALRWIHVIAGVAWIGTSFYFNWLNDRLATPEAPEPGVTGELWSVHGGGFYRVTKFEVAPPRMPPELHWFKWEAYLTWLSGASLLVLIYYVGADVYLVDPDVSSIGTPLAIALGAGTIVVSWKLYDRMCRSWLGDPPGRFAVVGFGIAVVIAWGLSQLISSRAAYIHMGAMLGTLMAVNVFEVIIPTQRRMVDDLVAGREPDAAAGRHAATRSLHNNYMTLPVLFIMISGHYPITYGHPASWAILAGLAAIGGVTRHHFNLRNRGRAAGWILPAAALSMVALAFVASASSGTRPGAGVVSDEPVAFDTARGIIVRRCAVCHASAPSHELFPAPPGGIVFDTPEQIQREAERIYATAVASIVMPLGNFTEMTEEERSLLGDWIRQGARID